MRTLTRILTKTNQAWQPVLRGKAPLSGDKDTAKEIMRNGEETLKRLLNMIEIARSYNRETQA